MRKRPLGTRRGRWGIGALVVASIAVTGGMSTSARTPERAPDPTDTQAGVVDEQPEFAGDYTTAGLGATAAAPGPDDPESKTEGLGDVGSNANHTPDFPGATGAPADDLPDPEVPAGRIGTSDAELAAAVADGATTRVIVMTKTHTEYEAELSPAAVDAQRATIDSALGDLKSSLQGTGSKKVQQYDVIPAAVYEVGQAGMDALLTNPEVASIELDRQVEAQLDGTTGIIDSDLLNQAGVLGNGFDGSPVAQYEVAIIDSGVDGQHNAFLNGGNRIVAEACFVDDNSCPNGANVQIGGNAGEECTHSGSDCFHGTHVAGISGATTYGDEHEGVGRGLGIVAINVASDNPASPRWTASFADINSALQHVLALKNGARPNIVSVNLSIGTSSEFNDNCGVSPSINTSFSQLRAAGVAPIVAAGNGGNPNQMSAPACEQFALSVGNTQNNDVPNAGSNSSPGLDWWAPGTSVESSIPTGDNSDSFTGTSMAAPHVAGAFGLLSECVDGNGNPLSLNSKISRFSNTGVNVTRNGVTRKRINVLDAATGTVNNNDFANAEALPAAGNFNDFDFTVCSDTEPGEPGPFSVDNGIWYRWTPNATGVATISTDNGGGNVTTFDTTLAVYTGNSLGSLQTKAFDDDSGDGLRSLVTMGVNAGTTYRIKVDGFAAQNGLLNLHLSPITPVFCAGLQATLVGGPLADTLIGTPGNDVIAGFGSNDVMRGGPGNDRICGDAGADDIMGGDGNDSVRGGPDADHINGDDGNDVLLGNAGGGDVNDVGDVINGGHGDDTLDGWVGNDMLQGGPDDDTVLGAAGSDTANYGSSGNKITANLHNGTSIGAGSDTLSSIENLRGSQQNDSLTGSSGANRLQGLGGNDSFNGRAGNDLIDGDGGKDTARFANAPGGVTADVFAGTATGDGADALIELENLSGSKFSDVLNGRGGTSVLKGGSGADTLRGFGGNDKMWGNGGADNLVGGTGNDTIRGGDGNDVLRGEAGSDRLFGEFGNDQHFGGANFDRCDGGPGAGDTKSSCEVFSNIP